MEKKNRVIVRKKRVKRVRSSSSKTHMNEKDVAKIVSLLIYLFMFLGAAGGLLLLFDYFIL